MVALHNTFALEMNCDFFGHKGGSLSTPDIQKIWITIVKQLDEGRSHIIEFHPMFGEISFVLGETCLLKRFIALHLFTGR